jgi:hypothetical protein
VICLGPRDPVDIAGPRPLSGVVGRPLNFTVRHARLTRPMYAYLYDSMIACYARQSISPHYVRWYAATTLASMSFLNVLALVAILNHWHYRLGEKLYAVLSASWPAAAAIGLALLGANLLYSGWRKGVAANPTLPLRSRWPANIYMLLSILAVLYVSKFAVAPHQ